MNKTEIQNSKSQPIGERPEYDKKEFWSAFRISSILHSLLFVGFIITNFISPKKTITYTPSVRVDLVGLPELRKKDLQPIGEIDRNQPESKTPTQETKTIVEKKDSAITSQKKESKILIPKDQKKPSLNDPKKTSLKNAIDRIKALAEIENEVKSHSKKKSTQIENTIQPKGNAIQKGNSITGDQQGNTDEYIEKMRIKLQENWNLPVWLAQQNLSAKVMIFIDRGGFVSKTVLIKSSGDKQFDDYVLKTVRTSQPFGTPPEDIQDSGLTLGFPL